LKTTRFVAALCALLAITLVAGCASPRRPAPVVDRTATRPAPTPPVKKPAAAERPAPPAFYTVRRGDTLYSIALEHGADYRDVARWNSLEDPTRIRVNQVLRVRAPEAEIAEQAAAPAPGPRAEQAAREPVPESGASDSVVRIGSARGAGRVEARPLDSAPSPQAARMSEAEKTAPQALRLPYSRENVAALSAPEPRPEAAKPAARVEAAKPPATAVDGIELVWPTKGRLVGAFADSRSRGIDISGNLGDPIVAAAPGKVIYAGTGIPGYGKFIVIKHANDVSTVYAHAKEISVKLDQSVAAGQKIGELGMTDTDRPKLHFQVRRFGNAVDPMRYLPAPG
jgi:lipoprotein NlpD